VFLCETPAYRQAGFATFAVKFFTAKITKMTQSAQRKQINTFKMLLLTPN
jgi:hypothetical protein